MFDIKTPVPRVASAVTWSRGPRPWNGFTHRTPTLLHALLGYYDLADDGQGIGRGGGGEDTDGDRRRSGGRQEGQVQRGEGARSDHEKILFR